MPWVLTDDNGTVADGDGAPDSTQTDGVGTVFRVRPMS